MRDRLPDMLEAHRRHRKPIAAALAMLAMVAQVLFFADHIGAVAAKSTGNANLDARLGIFEICTGNGIEYLTADGQPVSPAHQCPICENASVMAFGEPLAMPTADFPFVTYPVVWDLPRGAHTADTRFPGEQPIRAPPRTLV